MTSPVPSSARFRRSSLVAVAQSCFACNADIVGIAPWVRPDGKADVRGGTLAGSESKIAIIREAAGPQLDELEINTYPSFSAKVTDQIAPAAREVADRIRWRYGGELSERDVLGA